MNNTFRFACIGAAALAVSGCSLPNFRTASEPAPAQLKAPVAQPAAATASAPAQAAAEVLVEAKPTKPWAHVPIGNSGNSSDGGSGGGLSGGDEDSGWGET